MSVMSAQEPVDPVKGVRTGMDRPAMQVQDEHKCNHAAGEKCTKPEAEKCDKCKAAEAKAAAGKHECDKKDGKCDKAPAEQCDKCKAAAAGKKQVKARKHHSKKSRKASSKKTK